MIQLLAVDENYMLQPVCKALSHRATAQPFQNRIVPFNYKTGIIKKNGLCLTTCHTPLKYKNGNYFLLKEEKICFTLIYCLISLSVSTNQLMH